MSMRSAGLLAVWLVLAVAPPGSAQEWKPFTSKEGRFKALLPGQPEERNQQITSDVGTYTLYNFSVVRNEQTFMVMYYDLTEYQRTKLKTNDVLKYARDEALKSYNGKLIRERLLKLEGHTGVEFAFAGANGGDNLQGVWRMFVVKNRLYQVAVTRIGRATTPADLRRLFDGFGLLK